MIDQNTFAAWFSEFYARFWLIAAGITGDRSAADDIVQESALVALSKLADFTAGTSFAAWMSQIVRLIALNHARKTRNRATMAADPRELDHLAPASDAGDAVESIVDDERIDDLHRWQAEFDDDVMRALRRLNETPRTCLLLRTMLDLSYHEIATTMGIPEGTAMSHVHRARNQMREHLRHRYANRSS